MNSLTGGPLPIPVRPATSPEKDTSLVRAAFALMRAHAVRGHDPEKRAAEIARSMWPGDRAAIAAVERTAIDPATTTVAGWAEEVAPALTGGFIEWLAPGSAAAALAPSGITVPLDEWRQINLPTRSTAPTSVAWVGEASAIPVAAGAFTMVSIGPKKMGAIMPFSAELAKRANAYQIFETMLRREAGISLDAAFFATTAGSSAAHAGLLYGVTATAASGYLNDDLAALAEAVGTDGSGDVAFVAAPRLAALIRIRRPDLTVPVLASLAIPAGRLVAVDPAALVHGIGRDVEIAAAEEGLIHMETAPGPISEPGSPATVAAPVRSLYQTNTLALRLLMDVAFAKQRSGAVAYIDGNLWQ